MEFFTATQGLLLILGYAALVFAATYLFTVKEFTKDGFFLAGRSVGIWAAGMSIAASWVWAPALFVSAEKAYVDGLTGLFWFTVPNVATLLFFAYLATKLRDRFQYGFSLPEYIRSKTSDRVHTLYLVQFVGIAVCAFAVQLLAGSAALNYLTGLPHISIVILLTAIALTYSLYSGLASSIVTDYLQMGLIIATGAIVFPVILLSPDNGATLTSLVEGMGGASGSLTNIFSSEALWIAYAFGIPATIGLMSGTVGDQMFWQRAFAIKGGRGNIKKAFTIAAVAFACVPVLIGSLGFIARGAGVEITNTGLTNVITVANFVGVPLLILFVYMLLSGLVSTLDSALNAIASLAGNDYVARNEKARRFAAGRPWANAAYGRVAMLGTAALGVFIALIPGVKILYLWLFYGTFRAATFAPSVIMILRGSRRFNESTVFYGILFALAVTVPVFAFGNFNGYTHITVAGALATVIVPGILTYKAMR